MANNRSHMFYITEEICFLLLLVSITTGFVLSKWKCKNDGYESGSFTYSIKNELREPNFFHSIVMPIDFCNSTVLLKYMERACDQHNETFRNFSQTYFSGLGYYVSAINGVEEQFGENFWQLIEHTTGYEHVVGVHHYIPQNGDHVAWNLTTIDLSRYTTPAAPQPTES